MQLCRHLQCRACILKPPHQGLLGSSPTRRNSLPLGLGTGSERSQTCGVPLFKASPSLKVLNSLLLVSLDALTPLAHYVRKLRKRTAQSRDCASVLRNLEIGAQFPDSKNAQRNLEIAQIPKLCGTYILFKEYIYFIQHTSCGMATVSYHYSKAANNQVHCLITENVLHVDIHNSTMMLYF